MLTKDRLKKHALACGADLVGITSTERLRELPKEMNPLSIFPGAKSVVVLGYRIFRGCFRGIEEGTWWTSYNLMGYSGIRWVFQPVTMWNFTGLLEDAGYEAIPVVDNFPWSNLDGIDEDLVGQDFLNVNRTMYGNPGKYAGKWSKPVSPEKPAPDVFLPMKLLAFAAGLGNIGHSGMFLTPEFGPRQKFSCVITDAPLEPDPLCQEEICDRCMKCVKECPAGAISEKEKVSVRIAGRRVEWARVDFRKCSVSFYGGTKKYNPFIVSAEDEKGFGRQPYTESMNYKIPPILWDARGIEGQRGCQVACFTHLEEKGRLGNRFKKPFRRREKPWEMKEAKKGPGAKPRKRGIPVDE